LPLTGRFYKLLFGLYAAAGLSTVLRELRVDLFSDEACRNWWGRLFRPEAMLCSARHSDLYNACKGDSGGPLQCYSRNTRRWKLIGVADFSGPYRCGTKPMIYTRVEAVLDWISQHVQRMSITLCFYSALYHLTAVIQLCFHMTAIQPQLTRWRIRGGVRWVRTNPPPPAGSRCGG